MPKRELSAGELETTLRAAVKTQVQEVHVTSDGREFTQQRDAMAYQANRVLGDILNRECVGQGGEWSQSMFREFLVDNAAELAPLLKFISQGGKKR